MAEAEVLYDTSEGIATVTLNRPDRLNAWNGGIGRGVRESMQRAQADDDVKVIILTGAGRGFCAGADMNSLSDLSANGGEARDTETPPFDRDARPDFQHPMSWLPSVGKPIIAAINGPVAGMGLAFSLFCDMRFASETAVFMSAFSRRGLIAEHGTAWMLSRLVGHSRALDIMLSSRRVSGEEAYRIGLADRVFPADVLMAETRAYAKDIADNVSPRSTRVMKRQIWDALIVDLKESMDVADEEMALSLKGEDFREGVAHFLEKRPPRFTGR